HAAAARESGLPLIVHTRDADEETVAILAEESRGGVLRGVIHCFSSGPELAEKALDLGFFLSFSGIVTFKKAETLREVAKSAPPPPTLIETVAPSLAPVPLRGTRTEPAYVVHTAGLLAELRGVTREALAAQTTENFFRLFDKATTPVAA